MTTKKQLEAHIERLENELQDRAMKNDPKNASEHYWQCADAMEEHAIEGHLPFSVVESFEALVEYWVKQGKPDLWR